MKRGTVYVALALLLTLAVSMVQAQSLEERLQQYGDKFAQGYVTPIVDAFGASANSGWYNTADVSDGISISVGLRAMLMPVPDAGKTFKIESVYDGRVQDVPTAFGEKTQVAISGASTYPGISPTNYPEGFGLNWSPMLVPQASVGNFFGTRATLRYLPKIKLGDMGEFSLFGIGVQHSLSKYLPMVPLDLAAHVGYQNLNIGSMITTSAWNIGVEASKSLAILTVYGGVAYEHSSMSFSYNAKLPNLANPAAPIAKTVGFDAAGANSVRATVGATLNLMIFKVNADYSVASQPVAALGVSFGI